MSSEAIEIAEIEDVLGDNFRIELKLDALLETVPGATARYHELLRQFKADCVKDGEWDRLNGGN